MSEFANQGEGITIIFMARLSGDLVRHKLPTYTFGQNVIYTEKTGSTNTELKKLARQGAPEGLLYLAEEQLAGRGRLERKWYAPAGSSLLLSLLFRPGPWLTPAQSQRLTMLCALALANAIETHTGLRPGLKWPNDLVWHDGKKLAGILTEVDIEGERSNWVVVGVGLNVNLDFKKETGQSGNGDTPLAQTATSLSLILGRDTDQLRLPILQKFLSNVERRYDALRQGGVLPHREWRSRLVGLGQPVTIIGVEGDVRQGIMADVNENGALLLQQADGSLMTFLAGDVTLRRTG
ncbi:MAG: biotin--[acetyl-CoA-carboxylase] ligase [Anaerolineae bacterium]|nr:biotin--[acetyl-CoA-carboxylase] ligase [Anaerolineae bacterium]